MYSGRVKQRLLPPLWVLSLAVIALIVWLFVQLRELVFLLLVGYCISYLFHPALNYLEKKGIRRPLGFFVILFGVVLFFAALAFTAIPTILREYSALANNLPDYLVSARTKLEPQLKQLLEYFPVLSHYIQEPSDILAALPTPSGDTINKVLSGLGKALLSGFSFTLAIVNLALLPFIVFYLSVDFSQIDDEFLKLFPVLHRAKVRKILDEIDGYVSAFVRGQMVVGFILTLLYALGLGFLGVELWFLLAVLSGFGNMIPYLGTILGIGLSSIMALVTFGTIGHLVAVWIIFAVVQVLEGNFITPKVLGEQVGLSPLAIILAIIAGGTLFGLVGVILAVPGLAVIRVLSKHFYIWLLSEAELG